jgi:hypothetical protein
VIAAAAPRGGGTGRRADRLALAAAAALLLALALYGSRVHWVEEAGTAERDGYVGQAELLRSGSLPHDPYRPLLYPLLAAALAPVAGGAFAAARLLSNLAAAALAWLAWAHGRRLAGAAAGGWAMALAAVNPNLWIIGQHVTTDMLFAALAAACLLAGQRYMQVPATVPAVVAGLALGLAAFTRANALFLVPALLAAWWLAPRAVDGGRAAPALAATSSPEGTAAAALGPTDSSLGGAASSVVAPAVASAAGLSARAPGESGGPRPASGGRRRGRHLAYAAAAAVLVLLPHWALRQAEFGNPFYDENWKNLAWKLYGYPDWSYLDRVPFRSLAAVVAHDPAAVLRGWLAELERFAAAGAAQLLGTWAHVLLAVAGTLWAVAQPATRRPAAWLLFALGSFLAATAFAFFTWGRLLLLLLPGAYALAFAPWSEATGALPSLAPAWLRIRWPRLTAAGRRGRLLLTTIGAAAVLLLAVKTFAFRLPAFAARHPYVEVALLRRLDGSLPAGAALGGSSPFLGRYLRHRYVALPDAFGPETTQAGLYFAKLRPLLSQAGVAYLVIGPIDLRSRPSSLLGPSAPVAWLMPAGGKSGVVVWRVVAN